MGCRVVDEGVAAVAEDAVKVFTALFGKLDKA